MTKLSIYPINSVWSRVDSSDMSLMRSIYDEFTVDSGVSPFIVRKMPNWDGKLHLFNGKTRTIYSGLIGQLVKYLANYPYDVEVDFDSNSVFGHEYKLTTKNVNEFIERLNVHSGGLRIQPREHQLIALYHVLRFPRTVVVSPTGSGKSYIIYILMRFLHAMGKRILLIVPNLSLIQQMFSDFKDYSEKDQGWKPKNEIDIVSGGRKESNLPITLANWQAIYKCPPLYFSPYEAVIVDEVHTAQADSLKGIMEKCTNAYYRYGFTGTLQETKTHTSIIEGLFGPPFKTTTSKDLIDKGILSKLAIKMVFLQYAGKTRQAVSKMTYQEEIKFTSSNPYKRRFVCALAEKLKGNVLILVHLIEDHAKPLYEDMRKTSKKKILFISGSIAAEKREDIRATMEKENDCILIATYGTTSTGVNIKNIHHIIFASAFKSKIRVLQSIGRELRVMQGKEKAMLWDLVDDCSYTTKNKTIHHNYLMIHAQKRLQMYKDEQFEYDVLEKTIETE